MAKLVTKFKYLKASDRNTIGNYVRYIATRSGVEKIDESKKFAPETKKQSEFIKQMLIDFPDAKESIEYQDYITNRNRGNASELISRTLEDNMLIFGEFSCDILQINLNYNSTDVPHHHHTDFSRSLISSPYIAAILETEDSTAYLFASAMLRSPISARSAGFL